MTVAEDFAEELRRKLDGKGTMPAAFALDLGNDGYIHVDTSQSPAIVSHEPGPASVTIQITPHYLRKVLDKEIPMHSLMMTGRMKLKDNAMMALIFGMIVTT